MGGPRAWALLCLGLLLPGGSAAWNVGGAQFSGRRNWCSYVVTRTISCHVQNGTYLQRVLQNCPWPMSCPGNSYRTVVRPTYKVMYKTVTTREWRCCPGHSGVNCEEGPPGPSLGWTSPGLHWPGQICHTPAVWPWARDSSYIVQVIVQGHRAEGAGWGLQCRWPVSRAHSKGGIPSLKSTKLLCALAEPGLSHTKLLCSHL
uniref:EMI domain-containing protein n=1 Tax=Felis catus TaxID=9685 RepID=A0ABI8AHE5_FELCA